MAGRDRREVAVGQDPPITNRSGRRRLPRPLVTLVIASRARTGYAAAPATGPRRVPCARRTSAFEQMSKRRRGFQQREPGQARDADRPRRQGAAREARPQRPVPVRLEPPLQGVLHRRPLLLSTAPTTAGTDRLTGS